MDTPGSRTYLPPDQARWLLVLTAALAMVATLPGRTQGLGLITEPLLRDLGIERLDFANLNFWATILGAMLCLPCGWLLDRVGMRWLLALTLLALGGVVIAMSQLPRSEEPADVSYQIAPLFVLILLTRGLGQSALSVISITLVGKAAGRDSGPAMGVYAFVLTTGFMICFGVIQQVDRAGTPWRAIWQGIGVAIVLFAFLAWLLVAVAQPDRFAAPAKTAAMQACADGYTLARALATPVFWVFALSTSLYGLLASGVALFNEDILTERGFDRSLFLTVIAIMPVVGLLANLATGALVASVKPGRLLAAALAIQVVPLLLYPSVREVWQVYLWAAVMGVAGGMMTVLFFSAWGQLFGPSHLGKIQGAAQMCTVLASALGPVVLAAGKQWTGSYGGTFLYGAGVSALLAVAAWCVPLPRGKTGN